MSNDFRGEGNIGTQPEFHEFPNGNNEPRRLLRLNVYFDNPVPRGDSFEDIGGFWLDIEWWHRDAEHYATLFRSGMRVMAKGKMIFDTWEDQGGETRGKMKLRADRIAILPTRVESVTMTPKSAPQGVPEASVAG